LFNRRKLTGKELVAKIMSHVEKRLPVHLSADEAGKHSLEVSLTNSMIFQLAYKYG